MDDAHEGDSDGDCDQAMMETWDRQWERERKQLPKMTIRGTSGMQPVFSCSMCGHDTVIDAGQ